MSKEEKEALLQKARNDFPIGSKCTNNSYDFVIDKKSPYFNDNDSILWNGNGLGRIWDGQWAKIISSPIPNLQNVEIY